MKGLYLNVDVSFAESPAADNSDLKTLVFQEYGLNGQVIFSDRLWKQEPVIKTNDEIFVVAGWFIYNGKLNNIECLYKGYSQHGSVIFNEIELGNFVIAHANHQGYRIFNDLVGLSTHYFKSEDGMLRIAPTAALLEQYTSLNEENVEFFNSQGHMFDSQTCLNHVYRLEPGAELQQNGLLKNYGSILDKTLVQPLEKVRDLFKEVTDVFDESDRALALSGGLDSRLMLTVTRYNYGYTYGPTNSGDRVIARHFSDEFEHYKEFSIRDALENVKASLACEYYFKHNSKWISGLIEAYTFARNNSNNAHVLFDGYLGDVFQRGTFIKFFGILGSIFKMFPFLYKLPISDRFILRKRYSALDDKQFSRLWQSYNERTKGLPLDNYQKVTFYETLYGRAARYVVNGGNITANQIFTDVPVFMSKKVFNSFIFNSFYDAVNYKHLAKIWKNVPQHYKTVRTDSGLKPETSPFLAPFVHVGYRFMLNYLPWMKNYGDEISRINNK